MYVSVKFGFGKVKKNFFYLQKILKIEIDYEQEFSYCRVASKGENH